jgi:thiamine biosynthesis protein ThiS
MSGRALWQRPFVLLGNDEGCLMTITVNGKAMEVGEELSVEALLAQLGIPRMFTAVAINRDIMPKSSYASTRLSAGDRVEIVRPMGGGA